MKILVTKRDFLDTYANKKFGLKAASKYKSWFPVHASPELAGLVANLMGDGYLEASKIRSGR